MKTLLFYHDDFKRHNAVSSSWKRQCVRNAELFVDVISFNDIDYPFHGKKGEILSFLHHFSGDYSSLFLIIGELQSECASRISSDIFRSVLFYPEVTFLFQDTSILRYAFEYKGNKSIRPTAEEEERGKKEECERIRAMIIDDLISAPQGNDIKNIEMIPLVSDLFDASNLRLAARAKKHWTMSLADAFESQHSYRKDNLAIIVDPEREQSLLNSYIFFAKGYRCLPISTLKDLFLRYCPPGTENKPTVNYSIIVREFDLQFPDEKSSEDKMVIDGKTIIINAIDYIRGYKLDNGSWIDLIHPTNETNNLYWRAKDYDDGKVYFIAQGLDSLLLKSNQAKNYRPEKGRPLELCGIKKPLSGIYQPLDPLGFRNDNQPEYNVDRSRKEHEHSVPLDLYDIAFRIYARAKSSFNAKQYVLSAILSRNAIELLNRQHISLSIPAYHLLAISENAIAMSSIGGDEQELAKDCKRRIDMINERINGLVKGTAQDPENVLNQIFSDCRLFCKEKEHFDSEDVFISAMAHLNEGFSIFKPNTWHCLQRMKKLFKRSRV